MKNLKKKYQDYNSPSSYIKPLPNGNDKTFNSDAGVTESFRNISIPYLDRCSYVTWWRQTIFQSLNNQAECYTTGTRNEHFNTSQSI